MAIVSLRSALCQPNVIDLGWRREKQLIPFMQIAASTLALQLPGVFVTVSSNQYY